MELTSVHNPRLQDIRRAVRTGDATREGFVVVEGPHLLQEAVKSRVEFQSIVTTAAGQERYSVAIRDADCEVIQVPTRTFGQMTSTETAQEVLAVIRLKEWTWADLVAGRDPLVLVLDAVQDPGNAGTLVRSAEAFGASGIVLLSGSVRVSNPKFLRATAGSILRMAFVERLDARAFLALARDAKLTLWALVPRDGESVRAVDFRTDCALVVGNEGAGVSELLMRACKRVSILTRGVESLNASVACSIALYEAHNQKMAHEPL